MLDKLNSSLKYRDIEQLNEILIWTIYASKIIIVDEIRAVLLSRFQKPQIQSLKDRVIQKYSELLRIEEKNGDNCIYPKTDNVEEYFRNLKHRKSEDQLEIVDPVISMTIHIKHVKRSLVREFFWDLSEKIVLENFEFTNPATSEVVSVSANKVDSQLSIIQCCVDVLLDESREETKVLANYAVSSLPSHIKLLRDYADGNLLIDFDKSVIIRNLVDLLESPGWVDRHLTTNFLEKATWLEDAQELQALDDWLRDASSEALNRKQIAWLNRVNAEGSLLYLRDIAKMIARHWLSRRSWKAVYPFSWVSKYVHRLGEYEMTQIPASCSENNDEEANLRLAITDRGSPTYGATERPSIDVQITTAAEWCKMNADIAEDSIYYERLGCTYQSQDEIELALQHFEKAKNMQNRSWHVFQALATLHFQENQDDIACQDMETCISHLGKKWEISPEEKIELVKNLIKVARIHIDLGDPTAAIERLRKAIDIDEYFYQSHYELFSLCNNSGRDTEATELLDGMMNHPAGNNELTHLTQLDAMLLEYTKWMGSIESFVLYLQACKKLDRLHAHLKALQQALGYAEKKKMQSNFIKLLLAHGIALFRYSTEVGNVDLALSQWEKCCDQVFNGGSNVGESIALLAARYIFNYNFTKIKTLSKGDDHYIAHLKILKDLAEKACNSYNSYKSLNYSLARVYSRFGNQEESHALLLDEIKAGFDLLSDEDPWNDGDGYQEIAYVLTHTGDDLNALSAWSLIGPPERRKVDVLSPVTNDNEAKSIDVVNFSGTEFLAGDHNLERPLHFNCDGLCGTTLRWSDGLWFCKICDNVQFDDECFNKLQKGTLSPFVCSRDHEWLYVPPWTDEYRETGKRQVHMGGYFENGKRVGGAIVPVEEWLDSIRVKWGIEKPLRTPKIECKW